MPLVKIHMGKNKMFPLGISCLDDSALVANVRDDSWIWHLRYGHSYFNALKLLSHKKMVHDLPVFLVLMMFVEVVFMESNINNHFRL